MTAAEITVGCLVLAVLLFAAGWGVEVWLKRRDAHITAKKLRRYNMAAFRGTKDRWLS